MSGRKISIKDDHNERWINPSGGYGDLLMLSGVLKQCFDRDPQLKYNLVRRAVYSNLLDGHPAIKKIGHPPTNSQIITTDYWSKEKTGEKNNRPYQILARLFGLRTPVKETLFLPGNNNEDKLLQDFIPSQGRKIAIIAPSSASPRKMMETLIWQKIVEKLKSKGLFVIQVGLRDDPYIKGAYSLLGLTTIYQLISLLFKTDVIISVDNLIMNAAHLIGKPAIIIWGPTNSKIYGYPEQIHIQCSTDHCDLRDQCLEPYLPDNYKTPCPFKTRHCMRSVSTDKIINSALNIFFPSNI